MNKLNRFISQLNKNIVRVSFSYENEAPAKSFLISDDFACDPLGAQAPSAYRENQEQVDFINETGKILSQTEASLTKKEVYRCVIDGEPIIGTKLTANGEVSYIENAESRFERYSYSGRLVFEVGEKELLLGLGQYEDGIYDYRNHTEYLYESNMRIALPFLITTGGYAIFIDTESNMIFKSESQRVTFEIDTTKDITYYVILGKSIPEILRNFQELTGRAAMLPRWCYGYVQSKERYKAGDELVDTFKQFRDSHIPIDCIVQDWYTWEDGLWGEKTLDKSRYPDFGKTVEDIHALNGKLMVSIWPNMSPKGENYKEFADKDGLLDNSNVYNAYDEGFRELYWQQCQREIMSAGTDSLWCDNSEPFSDADWNGVNKRPEELRYEVVVNDSKKSMTWERLNTYGLVHAKGIWENWRKSIPEKRVVNLTRSGYVSGQQYGAILWSGDISARWDTIRRQITEGIKMGLCGYPYWTLDIGGFFTVKDKYENRGCNSDSREPIWFWNGDFNDGVNDPGYRELYTRWIQFGTFLPMFRSHGTDTPREPWRFINKDDVDLPFYETILKYIRLRYRLLPYIYSLGYKAHTCSYILMRALAFDFAADAKSLAVNDEYMFGDAFLVAPVYEPMYYGPDGVKLTDVVRERSVYLPESEGGWYDYYSGKNYEGAETLSISAGLDTIPLFVRAGSIIPVSPDIEYSDEQNGRISSVLLYEGRDGEFTLYNDAGDGYEYLKGECTEVTFKYSDRDKTLFISAASGDYEAITELEIVFHKTDGITLCKSISYKKEELIIALT